ncbi:hypothetical protein Naga_100382g2 [Nannochloropsis gaditana]|uniref:Uncharacterized protein n=1 Tax=Nannochloropsis gaditana TaxID=72520 RepID=W7TAI5_9STRA|nr:hypothetical protein Naga_100382g2 [Nannochloropsis gaditana]
MPGMGRDQAGQSPFPGIAVGAFPCIWPQNGTTSPKIAVPVHARHASSGPTERFRQTDPPEAYGSEDAFTPFLSSFALFMATATSCVDAYGSMPGANCSNVLWATLGVSPMQRSASE